MIAALEKQIGAFPGAANRTRCFAHVLNLVAKSIIKIFDVPMAEAEGALSNAQKELARFANEVEVDDDEGAGANMDRGDDEDDDDIDGWIDEHADMCKEDLEALDASVQPVCLVLTKVSVGDY
jgi:hypothetical protein